MKSSLEKEKNTGYYTRVYFCIRVFRKDYRFQEVCRWEEDLERILEIKKEDTGLIRKKVRQPRYVLMT